MPRPDNLDLRAAGLAWRTVPMPGANLDLDLVPLASDGAGFTILARFPAGFLRAEPGGYLDAEDFFVLEGHLELEGVDYGPGRLTHVPARYRRTRMHSPQGCTALAWFGGPAVFREEREIAPCSDEPIRSWDLTSLRPGEQVRTTDSSWQVLEEAQWRPGSEGFDLAGTGWARERALWPGAQPLTGLVVRTPVGADG